MLIQNTHTHMWIYIERALHGSLRIESYRIYEYFVTRYNADIRCKGFLMWKKDKFFITFMFPPVSSQISLAASSAGKAMERTELVLPQVVQDGLNNGLHKFMSSLQNPEFSCFLPQGKFAITCYQSLFSSTYGKKSSESQMA
jgi:hypothetical protein